MERMISQWTDKAKKMKKIKQINFTDFLDKEVGKKGTSKREIFEYDAQIVMLCSQLRGERKAQKLSKKALSKKAGVKKTKITAIENVNHGLKMNSIIKIATALGMKIKIKVLKI